MDLEANNRCIVLRFYSRDSRVLRVRNQGQTVVFVGWMNCRIFEEDRLVSFTQALSLGIKTTGK